MKILRNGDSFRLRKYLKIISKKLHIYALLVRIYLHLDRLLKQFISTTKSFAFPGSEPLAIMGSDSTSRRAWNKKLNVLRKRKGFASPSRPADYKRSLYNGIDKVSVISSLYNSDEYLENWISNLKEQTIFDEVEIVIVSVNPSSFETDLLNAFSSQCSNVKIINIQERIGIYKAWNIAIKEATGNLITNANADDLRRFDSLEIQRSAFTQNPAIHITYQDFYISLARNATWHEIETINLFSRVPEVTFQILINGNNPPHNAPMWRKNLHDELGGFDETYLSSGDYEFWLRCVLAKKVFFNNGERHVSYFLNPKGMSTKRGGPGLDESLTIKNEYRKRADIKN